MILEDGGKLMTTCRSGACDHGQLYPLTIDNFSSGETRGDTVSFTAGLNTRLEGRQRLELITIDQLHPFAEKGIRIALYSNTHAGVAG